MMRFFSILAVWLCVTTAAFSQDEPLPDSVATPYLAYEAAVEAGEDGVAADAAERAWRAAIEAGVDPAILSVLAENAGFYAHRTAQFEIAEEAFLSAAEMNRLSAGDPLLRARALRYVSDVQLRQGENRRAFRTSESAVEILEALPQSPHVDMEIAIANAFMSSSRWIRGHYNAAGRYGERAVHAARRAGIVQDPVFGVAAFQAGAHYSYQDDPLEAAYWMTVAWSSISEGDPGSDLESAAQAWGGMERAKLDSEQRALLFDRLRSDGLYQREIEEAYSEETYEPDEGRVDAVALDRRAPNYPPDAAMVGAEGFALMRFDVNEEGRAENIEVVYSIPYRDFGEEGLRTIRQWRYQPATQDGVPIVRRGVITRLDFMMAD